VRGAGPVSTSTTTAAGLSSSGRGAAQGGAIWIGSPPRTPPRRIITLAPSLTDVVVALGATSRLVGVTRVDHAPEVGTLPRVGGFLDPNPEIILGLKPDLVLWVTDGGALPTVRRLAELANGAFPILAIPIITVADVSAAARLVGEALGDPAGGAALAGRLEASVERLRARAVGLQRRRVLFVVGRDPLVVAGPGSFPTSSADRRLRQRSGRQPPWPVYPVELAVGSNPDLVIDAALDEPRRIQRLAAVPAVRPAGWCASPATTCCAPGPR
jgi:iron complex transport system substrate-binding protein